MFYDDALDNPYDFQPHYNEWLFEVQTGMTRDGEQTSVSNPAVPTCIHRDETDAELTMFHAMRARETMSSKVRKRIGAARRRRKKTVPRVG